MMRKGIFSSSSWFGSVCARAPAIVAPPSQWTEWHGRPPQFQLVRSTATIYRCRISRLQSYSNTHLANETSICFAFWFFFAFFWKMVLFDYWNSIRSLCVVVSGIRKQPRHKTFRIGLFLMIWFALRVRWWTCRKIKTGTSRRRKNNKEFLPFIYLFWASSSIVAQCPVSLVSVCVCVWVIASPWESWEKKKK